jgi:hypothetical protein
LSHDAARGRVVIVRERELSIGEYRIFASGCGASALLVGLSALAAVLPPFDRDPRAALTVLAVGTLLLVTLLRWEGARSLSAELDSEGVRILNHADPTWAPRRGRFVPWSVVSGYRDDRAERVVLVLRERVFFRKTVVIPTYSEVDRTAVLAILDEHGIPRLE